MGFLHSTAAYLLLAATSCMATAAWADDIDDAHRMLQRGEVAAAGARADALLAKAPKEARPRFLRGMVLMAQGRSGDALAVFRALTEDYPELPEPYNNLAVLHGARGDYEAARMALEAAVRARPDFATGHENLGDLYVRLATLAYDRSLGLLANNPGARTKLKLAQELLQTPASPIPVLPDNPAKPVPRSINPR